MEPLLPVEWALKAYECVTSTMDIARLHLFPGAVIWAKSQTKGRGRHGRGWESHPGNLLCSFVLEKEKDLFRLSELAFVCAVAVGEAVASFLSKEEVLSYKWPNDILIQGCKAGGILLEVEEPFVIVGVGINLVSSPENTPYPATSLKAFCAQPLSCEKVLEKLTDSLAEKLALWKKEGFDPFRQAWLKKAHYMGQEIRLKTLPWEETSEVTGLFWGIDEQGSLLLKLPDGSIKKYATGDVFGAI